jgi:hypothetical protein
MRRPQSVKALEDLGRVQLSPSFFMRDFLYSEISQIEGIPNIPDHPDVAIEAGRHLCREVLEPIQHRFGRISIRSAYRSSAVNQKGAENKNQYNCASNEKNAARHIWDVRDSGGNLGAMACIVVNRFIPYYQRTSNWQSLAWWVHDLVPAYSTMTFFPRLAAFNISWHPEPERSIRSHVPPMGLLTRPGTENHPGDHASEYESLLRELAD